MPVPVLVWIPLEYPIAAPYVFVDLEALQDASLMVGTYVDANGLFSLPILAHWDPNSCTVLDLVREMTLAVLEDPPVYSEHMDVHSPPLPPRVELPSPQVDNITQRVASVSLDGASGRAPILPPKPSELLPSHTSSENAAPVGPATESLSSGVAPPKPAGPPLPVAPPSIVASPPTPASPGATASPTPLESLMDLDSGTSSNPVHHRALDELRETIMSLAECDRQSAKDALQTRVYAIQNATAQFQSIFNHERTCLDQLEQALGDRRKLLTENIKKLDTELYKAQRYTQDYGPDINLQTLLVPEPVGLTQLRRLVARDHAITDTIHALNRMLARNTITLDIFMKKVRSLGREQFLTRTHVNKILSPLVQKS